MASSGRFFVPDYPTVEIKSRLTPGRHLVFLQTQGEPEVTACDIGTFFDGLALS